MKINDVKHALSLFEKYNVQRGDALNSGNSKKANSCYDKIRNIVTYLKEEKAISILSTFYNHPNPYVRLNASANLLPIDEKRSLSVIKTIANEEKGIISVTAKYTIKEWENGNLKGFYTL